MTIRTRFTLLTAAVTLVVVAALGVGLYAAMDADLRSNFDGRLRSRASGIDLAEVDSGTAPVIIEHGLGRRSDSVFLVGMRASDGRVVFHTNYSDVPDVTSTASDRSAAMGGQRILTTIDTPDGPYRLLLLRAPAIRTVANPAPVERQASQGALLVTTSTPVPHGGIVLALGLSLAGVDDSMRQLSYLLLAAAGAALLLGAAGGLLAGRAAVRPVVQLSDAVEGIGDGDDLARRLPTPASKDEVERLANRFNQTLDRIEMLVERQRRFAADASHELRTPLTAIRAEVELLRRHPDMPASERAEIVDETVRNVDRLSRTVVDLLALAQRGAGPAPVERVDWDTLAAEVSAQLGQLCAPRPVTLRIEALGWGRAHEDSVIRLVRILAENVQRHTPEDTPVLLEMRREGGDVLIAVSDGGPGVPPDMLPRIFERFVRGGPGGDGAGLGLALAQSIVVSHGGSISARPAPGGGLRVEARLPAGGDGDGAGAGRRSDVGAGHTATPLVTGAGHPAR